MANGLTVEELWKAYEDEDQSFAQDVYEFFGGVGDRNQWEKDWGMYLPTYDPTDVEFAGLERDIGLQKAVDVFDISKRSAGRTYQGELDTLSTGLGKVLGESETTAGHLGLRSGSFETAIEDTIAASGNKVKDLGDRMSIQADEDENTYNAAIVDSTLDFDKSERESKKDLYDRTLKMISKIAELGAFTEAEDPCPGEKQCIDGSCGGLIGCGCPENADDPTCVGTGDQLPGNEGIADAAYCTQICTPYVGMTSGGMTCYDSCLGTPTLGDGEFDPHIFNQMAQIEADEGCEYGAEWVGEQWVCAGGDDVYNPCAGVTGCAFNYASGNCQDVHGNACDCNCA